MGKRGLPVWGFRVFRLTGKLRLPMAPVLKAFRNRNYLNCKNNTYPEGPMRLAAIRPAGCG